MDTFKILIPSGYQIYNSNNDNIDINLVLRDGSIYFATLFTIENIQSLLKSNSSSYFWATDMIIVKDLEKLTIKEAIKEIIRDDLLEVSFSKIGIIGDMKLGFDTFEDIQASI